MEENQQTQQQMGTPVGFPGTPTPTVSSNNSKKSWKWLVILILFLVVIGGVTFFVYKSSKTSPAEGTPESTGQTSLSDLVTPEPTPAPTPFDKTQLNISVLNGTGVAGEAGVLATQLKDLGYTNVTTGNAATDNATDTQVTFSPSIPDIVVTEINGKLNEVYISVTTSNSTLPSGTDIQITTGPRKGSTTKTATDTPAPTATP